MSNFESSSNFYFSFGNSDTAITNKSNFFIEYQLFDKFNADYETLHDNYTYGINRIYDGVEAETRKSQARFQII